MTRLEKCELAIQKGYSYNEKTGEITSNYGRTIGKKQNGGYVVLTLTENYKKYYLLAHHFAWYWVNKEIVGEIDHINNNREDNRIINLRSVTSQENSFNNSKAKGYYYHKSSKKFMARIQVDRETIYLGTFETENEAKEAYLNAKLKYHIIQ